MMRTITNQVEVIDADNGKYMRSYSKGKASWHFWATGNWHLTQDTIILEAIFQAGMKEGPC